jgi:hypothetical protein
VLQFPETTAAAAAAAAAATAAGGSLSPFSSQLHGKAQTPAARQGAGGEVGRPGHVQAACQVPTGAPGWFARVSPVLSLVELL